MTAYGSLEHLLDYVVITPKEMRTGEEQDQTGLDTILTEKVQSLATILQDIENQMQCRKNVSAGVIARIYKHYFYVKAKLLVLDQWPLNGNRAIEQRRTQLETTLDTLLHEHRGEQVQAVQDISRLKAEFWRWFREYCDAMQRVRLVMKDENGI